MNRLEQIKSDLAVGNVSLTDQPVNHLRWAVGEIEKLRAIVEPIRLLTTDELSSVTIYFPNPEFDAGDDYAIAWQSGDEYPKPGRTFYGDSLAQALAKAVEAKQAAEASS